MPLSDEMFAENCGHSYGRRVKHLFARLILVLALVVGTFHAPAIAHSEPEHHHAEHGKTSAPDVLADDSGGPESSPDTGDSVHHHHCPAAVAAKTASMTNALLAGSSLRPAHRTAALSSFSQAPPTEPPPA
jgi:hypothetical protein